MIKSNINSIFTTTYWGEATSQLYKLRMIAFSALIVALSIIINFFYIPVSQNLHISFTFLIWILGSIVFGPVTGLVVGVVYDLLGFMITPSYVFFPGYTLSAMLEFFVYGLFLYNKRISVLRIFSVKFVVNYGIHVGLGSLWSSILFGKAYYYFFIKSIIKNTIMLPIEIVMIVVMLQVILPLLVRKKIVVKQGKKYIPII